MQNAIPEVDAYINKSAEFAQPVLKKLRELFHAGSSDIEESIKWGWPFFEYKGIVGYMAAYKTHVSYGFWKAPLMSDPEGILDKRGRAQMAGRRASSLEDLPSDRIMIQYIREAVDLNERGVKVPRPAGRSQKPLDVPDDLMAALLQNPEAQATFDEFSPSKQRDYVEWVTEAKRQATRDKRLATAIEWMEEGKPRNWKYMKEYK